jgi:hypothetical protein
VSRLFPPAGWAVGLSLVGAAALGIVAPAAADRPVQLTFKENPTHARITAKWGDGDETAPKVSAQVSNQVLILSFDEKVTIDLKKLKESLPTWAAVTFMDPDGMTARIGLKQTPRLAVSVSADLVAVDLIPETVKETPPKIVSPLVAKRAAETEAKRVAALPPPVAMQDLEVRGSHAGDSSRMAFYWDGNVGYKVVKQGEGTLTLQFARRAKPDLAYLRITPPANLADFKGENSDRGYTVTITSKDKLPIKHFLEEDVLVIDISKSAAPAAPSAKPAAQPQPQAMAAAPPAKPPADTPILLAPPKVQTTTQVAAVAAPVTSHVIGGPDRATVMARSWNDPTPANGIVTVRAAPITGGLELTVTFAAPAPAAVFARGNVVWAVFGAGADLKLDQTQFPAGYRARVMRQKDAAILRIEAPKGLAVSAEADESVWTIKLAAAANRPQRFLKPERKPDDSGRARIETMLIGAAGLVWFEDPVVGDQIAAAIAYGPSSSSPTPRDFVEASLPATSHGLAIAPKSDSVLVTLEGERVAVSMGTAAQSMPDMAIADVGFGAAAPNPAFIDFATWGAARGDQYFEQLRSLQAAIVAVDPATPQGASAALDLVRFYIGHQQPQEALGLLRVAVNDRPELDQDPTVVGMRGAANYMAGRLKEAERDLSRGVLRGDPSAALWRAAVAAGLGEWERAIELFRDSDKQMQLYPSSRAADFAVIWAEAALQVNDFDAARRQANLAISSGDQETKERAQLALANLRAVLDGPGPAYADFEKLSQTAVAPVAVRAELRRLELAVPAGKMTAAEAAQELESLRFLWRGDEVEMATVGILADQYMRVGRFRDALLLAQSTALRDADAPGARDLRIKLSDYFRRLYLNGEADRLDPIQAVALFYEFDDTLMPIGPDGDQMVRKLAQRLVAFDLLEPASALLQYQVDNRIRGTAKSVVAVDLATIYLWDKRPDKALAAINSTRQPQLPKELALERRLLEAAAYRDMGRFDHVVELVEPLAGVEAKSLLADAYWRDRRWPQAAAAMIAMLPPPAQAQTKDADIIFKTAIAARMSKDAALIAQVRGYGAAMAGNSNKASFDLIVAQSDVSGASVSEAVRRLADAPRVDAFAAAMKQRFEAPKTVAQATPPPTAG